MATLQGARGASKSCQAIWMKLKMFHRRRRMVGRGGGPTHLTHLSQPPNTINGSLRVIVQGEVIEHSFAKEHLCFKTLQRHITSTLVHRMHLIISPLLEWCTLLDKIAVVATKEYRSIVFEEPQFIEYFRILSFYSFFHFSSFFWVY